MKSTKLLGFVTTCFLCYIACSLSYALGEDTTFVPLEEWKDYTYEEKDILRNRWTVEKVEAILGWLKGDKSKPSYIKNLPDYRFDLRGIPRAEGGLLKASLYGANLQGADLLFAMWDSANLGEANLQGADLWHANLRGANLRYAMLQGASLRYTMLQGVNLTSAKLQDADLFGAIFDSTYLWQVNLGEARNIRYIVWGDSINNRYIIGEEKEADSTKSDEDFCKAEITYRDLKAFYKRELMNDVAMEFHFRENQVITKGYAWYDPVRIFRIVFLRWAYGYGSRPLLLLWYSLIVVGLFSVIFLFLTINPITKSGIHLIRSEHEDTDEILTFRKGRLILDCFYFSLLSFCTFGYGALQPKQWLQFFRLQPLEFKPVRWARVFVGIEAALGIWIFALLVTVLFGRG